MNEFRKELQAKAVQLQDEEWVIAHKIRELYECRYSVPQSIERRYRSYYRKLVELHQEISRLTGGKGLEGVSVSRLKKIVGHQEVLTKMAREVYELLVPEAGSN